MSVPPSRPPSPPPPPPPPPPDGDPDGHAVTSDGGARSRPTGLAGLHSLRDQASPYSVLLAVVVALIMVSPNAVFFLLDLAMDGDLPQPTTPSDGMLVFGLVVSLVLQIVIFIVAMLPLIIRRRLDRRLFGPTQPTGSWVALGLGFAAGLLTLFAAYGTNIVLSLVAGAEDPVEQQLLQDALAGGVSLVLAAAIAVVVAPVVEEVVFRGVLFRALGDRLGLWPGAIVSAAVFAVIHIEVVISQPIALGGLFAVGLTLALAFHYTGNLLVPILGHAVFNASSLALALVVERLGLDELVALASATTLLATAVGTG